MNEYYESDSKTVKERYLKLELSDEECERLARYAAQGEISIGELLTNFISDLTCSFRSNGSDEREFADMWYERCGFSEGFGSEREYTLLKWLLDNGHDVYDDFLEVIDDIKCGYANLEDYKKDPSVFSEEEIEYLKTDIEDCEKQIAEIKADFLKKNKEADWEKEVKKVNQWWKEKELLKIEGGLSKEEKEKIFYEVRNRFDIQDAVTYCNSYESHSYLHTYEFYKSMAEIARDLMSCKGYDSDDAYAEAYKRANELEMNETVLKPKEKKEKANEMSDDEKQSYIDGIEEISESLLLIQNDDLTKYSLVSVVGMDRQELMDVLSAMSEDDKRSIQAYLESKGAWTYEIANEDTKEFGEYHLDVRYNTDTEELVDMKRSGRIETNLCEEKESSSAKKSNRKGHCR